VNYYPRYPGDYLSKTVALTMVEDGAYTRLMDWYYCNETPVLHARRYAVARATTSAERAAVDSVLEAFFVLDGDAYRHERIDEEIEKGRTRIDAAKVNGLKGGRKPKLKLPEDEQPRNPVGSEKEHVNGTQFEPSGNPVGFQNGTQSKAPHLHTPYPIPQNQRQKPKRAPAPSPPPDTAAEGRRRPAAKVTPLSPDWQPKPTDIVRLAAEFGLPASVVEVSYADAFRDACAAKGYEYRDHDAAFRNCVRQDWPKLRQAVSNGARGHAAPTDRKARQLVTAGLMTGALRNGPPATAQPQEIVDVDARVAAAGRLD
jgi:uncharacterized protein YdaU (DUF1376 family)